MSIGSFLVITLIIIAVFLSHLLILINLYTINHNLTELGKILIDICKNIKEKRNDC